MLSKVAEPELWRDPLSVVLDNYGATAFNFGLRPAVGFFLRALNLRRR
jgi:hypothetical protein